MKSLIHVIGAGIGGLIAVAPALHDNLGWNSGTRLQAVYLQAADNSGYPTGAFYDTKLQENCTFQSVPDPSDPNGKAIYCLGPSYHETDTTTTTVDDSPPPVNNCAIANGYFLDSACTQAVASIPVGETCNCAIENSSDGVPNAETNVGDMIAHNGVWTFYRMGPKGCFASTMAGTANNFDWYPVENTTIWQRDITVTTTTFPPLTNYVKAARQVNVALDAHGNVIGTK